MNDPLPPEPPAAAALTDDEIKRYERIGKIYGILRNSTKVGDWALTKAQGLAGFELLWGGEIRGSAHRFGYTIRFDEIDRDERIDYVRRTVATILHEWQRKIRP